MGFWRSLRLAVRGGTGHFHAVDMETGAIVAVTLHGADEGDTATIPETVAEAGERITTVVVDTSDDEVAKQISAEGPREVVIDKGYHSRQVVSDLTEWGVRTYRSEPNRGRQRWPEQKREQHSVSPRAARLDGQDWTLTFQMQFLGFFLCVTLLYLCPNFPY